MFRSDVGILLRCACEKRSGWRNVSRVVHIAAAQLGPIEANCDRSEVVDRLHHVLVSHLRQAVASLLKPLAKAGGVVRQGLGQKGTLKRHVKYLLLQHLGIGQWGIQQTGLAPVGQLFV